MRGPLARLLCLPGAPQARRDEPAALHARAARLRLLGHFPGRFLRRAGQLPGAWLPPLRPFPLEPHSVGAHSDGAPAARLGPLGLSPCLLARGRARVACVRAQFRLAPPLLAARRGPDSDRIRIGSTLSGSTGFGSTLTQVLVGASSADIRLSAEVEVEGPRRERVGGQVAPAPSHTPPSDPKASQSQTPTKPGA